MELKDILNKILNDAKDVIIENINLPTDTQVEEIRNFLNKLGLSNKNFGVLIDIDNNKKLNTDLIGLWLFSYNEFLDAMETLELIYKPLEQNEEGKNRYNMIRGVKIKGGAGTVGFIQRSGESEILDNTIDDPRGSVAVEDFLIRDFSWVGIPIPVSEPVSKKTGVLKEKNKVKLIISFFLPYDKAWNQEKDKKIKVKLARIIEKQQDLILSMENTERLKRLLGIALSREEEVNWQRVLNKILISELIPISFVFLLSKTTPSENNYSLTSADDFLLDCDYLALKLQKDIQWCCWQGRKLCPPLKSENEKQNSTDEKHDKNCKIRRFFDKLNHFYLKDIDLSPYTMRFLVSGDDEKYDDTKGIETLIKEYFKMYIEKYIEVKNQKNYTDAKKIDDAIVNLIKITLDTIFSSEEITDENKKNKVYKLERIAEIVGVKSQNNNAYNYVDELIKFKETGGSFLNKVLLTIFIKNSHGTINLTENIEQNIKNWFKTLSSENEKSMRVRVAEIIESIKEPATINVLYRAFDDREAIKKYKTLLEIKINKQPKLKNGKIECNKTEIGTFNKEGFRCSLKHIDINPKTMRKVILNKIPFSEINIHICKPTLTKLNGISDKKFSTILTQYEELIDFEQLYIHPIDIFGHEMVLIIALRKEINKDDDVFKTLKDYIDSLIGYMKSDIEKSEIKKYARRSAIAAILTESYAHNIGAHGLAGLKSEVLNQWKEIEYEIRKKDSSTEIKEQSILWTRTKFLNHLRIALKDIIITHSNFPEYLKYLQGKSAFWAAIARGGALFGGKIITLWDLINDFGKNNLLCGSLGISERYKGINFTIHYNENQYNLGNSTIEDDLRFRFEDENYEAANSYDQWNNFIDRVSLVIKKKTEYLSTLQEEKISELKKGVENIKVFFPEGIVGQQAVYTIWENVIRNVKHCKKPESDIIPLHIAIDNKDKDKVKITTWIDLDSQKPEELDNAISRMKNWQGIHLENNKPNMGGTSQNILCAGMVYGLSYLETENIQKKNPNNKVMEFTVINDGKKKITYSFKVWKGYDSAKYSDLKGKDFDEIGPIGRYKIIALADENEKKELLKNPFLVRHVIPKNKLNNNDFKTLYSQWINLWLALTGGHTISIKCKEILENEHFENMEKKDDKGNQRYTYLLYHRTKPKDVSAEIEIPFKYNDVIGTLLIGQCKNESNILELIEILETSIEIFDNRINNLRKSFTYEPNLEKFKINVYPEEKDKIPSKNNIQKIHFGIFHLSFLETVTGKNNEKAVEEFLNDQSLNVLNRYEFIIITTGRGRDWWNDLNDELKIKIKFIPIENLEFCFENGSFFAPKMPAVGVKYALIKTIFGS